MKVKEVKSHINYLKQISGNIKKLQTFVHSAPRETVIQDLENQIGMGTTLSNFTYDIESVVNNEIKRLEKQLDEAEVNIE